MAFLNRSSRFLGSMSAKKDQTGFGLHLSFAEEMLKRPYWNDTVRKDFAARLSKIRDKHNDSLLNLSVVGEFSVGKSTFINALLRQDGFLESNALQGTTVSAAVIEHSDGYSFCATNSDGSRVDSKFSDVKALSSGIVAYTTDPEYGQKLKYINIRLPAQNLKENFRIIDTPGTNSLERWHEDVTISAISELSDTSIILIDSSKPIPETMAQFVEENLGGILDKCVFVATRFDTIRRREQEGVLEYIKNKIETRFNVKDPVILPYASIDVLDACEDGAQASEFAEMSYESEKKMFEHMLNNKNRTQMKKLTSLMKEMYDVMKKEIDKVSEEVKGEMDSLEEGRQKELIPYLEREIETARTGYTNSVKNARESFEKRIEEKYKKRSADIIGISKTKKSVDSYTYYIHSKLDRELRRTIEGIIEEERLNFSGLFGGMVGREMNEFYIRFGRDFRELEQLKVKTGFRSSPRASRTVVTTNEPTLKVIKDGALDKKKSYNKFLMIGMIIGFIVGLPFAGVGCIPGMFIGMLIGAKKAESLESVMKDLEGSITAHCDAVYEISKESMLREFDANASEAFKLIEEDINKYRKYEKKVEKWVGIDEKEIDEVREKYRSVCDDMNEILRRKSELEAIYG